ncbi:MAG: AMP-binding protein [Bacteroidetes bacterium]|nr:AMP-binding protein [Bacteroidota bacterium]
MKYCFDTRQFIEENKAPEKTAIAGSDTDITWGELQKKVTSLSKKIQSLQIPKEQPVLIYGHKESFFCIAILACIHSQTTYVPIDAVYPLERVKNIVEQTGSPILINCDSAPLDIKIYETIYPNFVLKEEEALVASKKTDNNGIDFIQHILFTSGSTGMPKGVRISKKAITAYRQQIASPLGFNENDVFLNQALFSFDVSLGDLIHAFSVGGTLVLIDNKTVKNAGLFLQRIKQHSCSVWSSTPSFVFLFLHHPDFNETQFPSLHTFLFAGEELPKATCVVLKEKFKNARIINAYGATEATIHSTLIELTDSIISSHEIMPIALCSADARWYLEKEKETDKTGKIVLIGEQIATGYLNNNNLTQEKFFTHNNQPAFKTGDKAYIENNLLFFAGRADEQIKLNGFRIELQEITNTIKKHLQIKDAVTIALKKGQTTKKIICFVISEGNEDVPTQKKHLHSFLEKELPFYMIPSDFIFLQEFPYNNNHKIDKHILTESYLQNN